MATKPCYARIEITEAGRKYLKELEFLSREILLFGRGFLYAKKYQYAFVQHNNFDELKGKDYSAVCPPQQLCDKDCKWCKQVRNYVLNHYGSDGLFISGVDTYATLIKKTPGQMELF